MQSSPGHTAWSALRLGVRSMLHHPRLALLFLALTLAQGVLQGALIWVLREVLLTFSSAGAVSLELSLTLTLLVFAVWLGLSGSIFCAELASTQLAQRVEIGAMLGVIAKLLTLSLRFFDKNSQGNLVMAAYQDLKGIRRVTLNVGEVVLYVTRLAGLVVVAWLMSPKLTTIGVLAVPLGIVPMYWIGRRIMHAADRERQALTTLYDSFLQVATGIRVIRVNHSEQRVFVQAQQIGQKLYSESFAQTKDRGLGRFLLETIAGLGLVVVLVIGGGDVAAGTMAWQSLLGLLIAVIAVYAPVVGLLNVYATLQSSLPNLDRIDTILDAAAEVADAPNAQRLCKVPDTIRLDQVGFVYEQQPVLAQISATFHRGETIGIVGPSGAGKSTLLSLLLRFYLPTKGAVLFDEVNVTCLRHADLMALCAIVLQEPFLFLDTVANNIKMGRPDADMDEVIAAAKAANIHDEILAMEQGYDTILGKRDDARSVSGGQRQRICIAAALLKNAPILFLDEATSSLDSLSERKVQAAIEHLMQGRTTFVIAHRLSTLRNASRIIVLDQGQMVGLGTHHELLNTCPTYQALWQSQQTSSTTSAAVTLA